MSKHGYELVVGLDGSLAVDLEDIGEEDLMAMRSAYVQKQQPAPQGQAGQQQQQQQQQQVVAQRNGPAGGRKNKASMKPFICNQFLLERSRWPLIPQTLRKRRRLPKSFYGVLDQADEIPEGKLRLLFGVISADWFNANVSQAQIAIRNSQERARFFSQIPLFLIQVDLSSNEVAAAGSLRGMDLGQPVSPAEPARVPRTFLSLERRWIEIRTVRS
jgi:hypothetical protein